MKTFQDHIKEITKKNYWYGQNYGLKHVVTESNLEADFKENNIKVIKQGYHEKHEKNVNGYCFHAEPHYHYIIEVPTGILSEAYEQKRSWATIIDLEADIIKTKGYGTIKSEEHLNNLKHYIGHYQEDERSPGDSQAECGSNFESMDESSSDSSSDESIQKYESKIQRIKKQKRNSHLNEIRKKSEETVAKERAAESANKVKEYQKDAKQKREETFNKIRGVEYLNTSELYDLEKELKIKDEVINIFPKWLHTTQVDIDEAKAGVENQTILKKITNAYAYIQQSKMNDLHTQKNKPLSIDEIAQIESMPGFKHTEKYMLKMMHSMHTKLYRDNKCCILWICGVPSSGKSLFMSILGNIMGPRVGLDKTQLYQDTLYANKLCEKNASSVTFEEYDLNSEKQENIDKAIAKLKALTSGKPESYRIALNGKNNQNKNDILNIKLVCITSNQHFTDIWKANNDSGFRDRLCTQQIDEAIPNEVRYKLDNQYDIEIMYTRYFYRIWKNWVTNGAPKYDELVKIAYHKNTIATATRENKIEILKMGCVLPTNEDQIIKDSNMSIDY